MSSRRAWVLLLLFTTGCGSGGAGDRIMDPPVIRTSAEANDYVVKARTLSEKLLEKVAHGDSLNDNEKDNLREAANIFKGITAFEPTRFGPYFGEGKIRYAIGEYKEAGDLMQQAIALAPPPKPTPPIEVIQMVAEAHYISSRCLFFMGQYEDAIEAASLAMAMAPTSPDYMMALASALIELKSKDPKLNQKNEDTAKQLINQALGLDPAHKEALRLAKFLKMR